MNAKTRETNKSEFDEMNSQNAQNISTKSKDNSTNSKNISTSTNHSEVPMATSTNSKDNSTKSKDNSTNSKDNLHRSANIPDRPCLPIDPYIARILGSPRLNRIVSATPGSGKTTRIPPAFLAQQSPDDENIILCVQPKRIACIAAAKRVAAEHGSNVGEAIGYHVRLDKKVSVKTRLLFVTTGILLRYLCTNPFLEGISHVIFDEFHERSIENDLAFAMVHALQDACRDDLYITVMSATLDSAPIAQFLAPADVFDIDAPIYPLDIRYMPIQPDKRFSVYIAPLLDAIDTALQATDGDCLVFLPGVGEINDAIAAARQRFNHCDFFSCHASLPIQDQAAILTRPAGGKRRLIFSTNVAESSLTIPGVRAVVDTGLVKQKFFDTFSGLSRLETQSISRASADQRAGRAARQAPGLCIRLWPQSIQNSLNAQTTPEIERLDLAQAVLQIAAWGLQSPESLKFLSQPAPNRIAEAKRLLQKLGALQSHPIDDRHPTEDNSFPNASTECNSTEDNTVYDITPLGRQMASMPLEPRLARWMLDAIDYDIVCDAALLAAFLSETPYRRSQKATWPKPNLYDDFCNLKKNIQKPENAPLKRIADDIAQAANDIKRQSRPATTQPPANKSTQQPANAQRIPLKEALAKSMLAAYADRLAQLRPQKKDATLPKDDPRRATIPIFACMSGNHGVTIAEPYDLKDESFFICADVDLVRGVERAASRVIKAFPIDPKWIPWHERRIARYEPEKDRVVVADAVVYDIFTLRETFRHDDAYRPLIRQTLLDAARKAPEKALNFKSDAWLQFTARCTFAKQCQPYNDIPDFNISWALKVLPQIIGHAATFKQLYEIDLSQVAFKSLSHAAKSILQTYAPERVTLQNGYETPVDYTLSPPVIRVKIQKAFGTYTLPRVGAGTTPVLIHLCAPNGRAAQMTQDLANFWHSTYADVRKLLRGRYPKHDWPEQPPEPCH